MLKEIIWWLNSNRPIPPLEWLFYNTHFLWYMNMLLNPFTLTLICLVITIVDMIKEGKKVEKEPENSIPT